MFWFLCDFIFVFILFSCLVIKVTVAIITARYLLTGLQTMPYYKATEQRVILHDSTTGPSIYFSRNSDYKRTERQIKNKNNQTKRKRKKEKPEKDNEKMRSI